MTVIKEDSVTVILDVWIARILSFVVYAVLGLLLALGGMLNTPLGQGSFASPVLLVLLVVDVCFIVACCFLVWLYFKRCARWENARKEQKALGARSFWRCLFTGKVPETDTSGSTGV